MLRICQMGGIWLPLWKKVLPRQRSKIRLDGILSRGINICSPNELKPGVGVIPTLLVDFCIFPQCTILLNLYLAYLVIDSFVLVIVHVYMPLYNPFLENEDRSRSLDDLQVHGPFPQSSVQWFHWGILVSGFGEWQRRGRPTADFKGSKVDFSGDADGVRS